MFWRRKRPPADFNEEVRAHLQLDADELTSDGLAETEARKAARRAFGNVTAAQERFYEKGRLVWFDDLLHDLRYGLRTMRKSPGFTLTVVLTLALGMGANTAIFGLIDAVLLRSLPVKDPSSLFFLNNGGARDVGGSPPYPCFERFRSLAKSFTGIAAYSTNDFGIRIGSAMEQVDGAVVSGNYFEVLGVTPFAGRLMVASDERLDPPVAVISYGFWQRRFAGKPDAIGKTFSLDDHRYTIIGITPKEFQGLTPGRHDDVMMPITLVGPRVLRSTGSWWFRSIARLRLGVTPEQARAEIDPIFQAFMNEFPVPADTRRDYLRQMVFTPASRGLDGLRKRFFQPLWALMAVVGLVLLIGCANITNLLLSRAAKREREFAVRVAIGAGRNRLFRQVLVETGLLFAAGAVAGIAVAWEAAHSVVAFFAGGSRPIRIEVQWDWRVLGFTAALSLLATLIFGAAPVLRALRTDPHKAMKDGGRASTSHGGIEMGKFLVAFQVALSMILVAGAALFLRTLGNLYTASTGFHGDQIALIVVHLADPTYNEQTARIALWDRMLAEVRGLPGVRSASLSRMTPLDGSNRGVGFEVPGTQPRSAQDRKGVLLPSGVESIGLNTVSEDYFGTFGTALSQGRGFTENDRLGTQHVALINESARRHFFGGRDPIGTVVKLAGRPQYQIVGVVQDAKQADLRKDAVPFAFIPIRQPIDQGAFMTLSIRTSGDPERMIATVERRARALGPEIRIIRTGTLARQIDESLLQERLISTLATAFGLLALLLSAVGLYGVLAYSVGRRTSEIGIRVTLGALPGQVAWSVLRQTMGLVAMGLVAGVSASIFLARAAETLLYGVTPTDAVAQVGSAALLAAVACLASYLPARRAGRIDPMAALRSE
ncbi:MAG TPA: ABC transporter permease [Bryobacteraceae bacterium]|jgi:predicted permease|nr:ABC transporter permease [Bryobacteraceae bacterium]